ncbi:hypothetical protein ACU4GH_38610 [Bradyrhizobium betae]
MKYKVDRNNGGRLAVIIGGDHVLIEDQSVTGAEFGANPDADTPLAYAWTWWSDGCAYDFFGSPKRILHSENRSLRIWRGEGLELNNTLR